MGLVFERSHSLSFALGIGKIVLVFHNGGQDPLFRHSEKNSLKLFLASDPSFFNIS